MTTIIYRASSPQLWPWGRLSNEEFLFPWLEGILNKENFGDELHISLKSMLNALAENQYGKKWVDLLWNSPDIPADFIDKTRDFLIECGYQEHLVDSLIVAIIRCRLRITAWPGELQLRGDLQSSISLDVGVAVLSGLLGDGHELTAYRILKNAEGCGSYHANELALGYENARRGNEDKKRIFLKLAFPLLRSLTEKGLELDESCLEAGVIFKWAENAKDDAEVTALLAEVLFVWGCAGQENDAVKMAAEAALNGSSHAWRLLDDWREKGHGKLVFDYLLSVGISKYSNNDWTDSEIIRNT